MLDELVFFKGINSLSDCLKDGVDILRLFLDIFMGSALYFLDDFIDDAQAL